MGSLTFLHGCACWTLKFWLSLYLFLYQVTNCQYTNFIKKKKNTWFLLKLNAFYGNLLKVLLIYVNWAPLFMMKTHSLLYQNLGKKHPKRGVRHIPCQCKPEFILKHKVFFSLLSRMGIFVFEVMSVCPVDQYQNAMPRAMLLHQLKNVQLQERSTVMTHDSLGHLKRLCMSVLLLRWALVLNLNGNAVAHGFALKKRQPRSSMNKTPWILTVWSGISLWQPLMTVMMSSGCHPPLDDHVLNLPQRVYIISKSTQMIWVHFPPLFVSQNTPNLTRVRCFCGKFATIGFLFEMVQSLRAKDIFPCLMTVKHSFLISLH